jgi:hypothetical protein
METIVIRPGRERTKLILYWIATLILAIGSVAAGIAHVLHTQYYVEFFTHLGYPLYFVTLLGVWKILGGIAVTVPGFPLLKEWAYAGLFFDMIGAIVSHLAVGDDFTTLFPPAFVMLCIVASWALRPESRKLIRDHQGVLLANG